MQINVAHKYTKIRAAVSEDRVNNASTSGCKKIVGETASVLPNCFSALQSRKF